MLSTDEQLRRVPAAHRLESAGPHSIQSTAFDPIESGRIIEIGAGDGSLLAELAATKFGASLYGAEISQSAVRTIEARGIPGLVQVLLFDGYSLPSGAQSFDMAVLSHVVEHVEHPRALLQEARRIARYVFVEVPLELHWRTPRDFQWTPTGHINFYNAKSIRQLIQSTGMTMIRERISCASLGTHTFRHPRSGLLRFAIRTTALKFARPLATQVMTFHWSGLARTPGVETAKT